MKRATSKLPTEENLMINLKTRSSGMIKSPESLTYESFQTIYDSPKFIQGKIMKFLLTITWGS